MLPIIAGIVVASGVVLGAFKSGHSVGHSKGHSEGRKEGYSLGKKAFLLGLPLVVVTVVVQGLGKEIVAQLSNLTGLTDIILNSLVSIGLTEMLSSWISSIMSIF